VNISAKADNYILSDIETRERRETRNGFKEFLFFSFFCLQQFERADEKK